MTVDYLTEFKRLSALLEAALTNLRDQTLKLAQAENDYRKARAKAWLTAEGLAKQREDSVNAITADARRLRDLADGLRRLELETVRARRDRGYPKARQQVWERAEGRCEARVSPSCNGQAEQVHHKAGRTGPDPHRLDNLLAVCLRCHMHIEKHREQARELGLSESRHT